MRPALRLLGGIYLVVTAFLCGVAGGMFYAASNALSEEAMDKLADRALGSRAGMVLRLFTWPLAAVGWVATRRGALTRRTVSAKVTEKTTTAEGGERQ